MSHPHDPRQSLSPPPRAAAGPGGGVPPGRDGVERTPELTSRIGGQAATPILLVDDELEVLRLMRKFLSRAGFEVAIAAGGEEALRLLRQGPRRFRAVVLDLTMPGLSGEDTLARLRALDREVPVILASGYSEEEVARRCAGLDFTSFLPKPYLPTELIAEVRRVIMAGHPRQDESPRPE